MITLKRLTYTTTIDALICIAARHSITIDALICIAARHSITADGARQQALDEIAASLNNVAAIIARHKLAEQLNAPIPPLPTRHDDSDGPDPEELEQKPETDPPAAPDLHPRQAAILRYIRTHPGCTSDEVADDCDMKVKTVFTHISTMRQMGVPIVGTNTRPTHYHIPETRP